jgi:hypothetical protein
MALRVRTGEGGIRKSTNLGEEVGLEEASVKFDDVPIGRGEGLNVDSMRLWRINMEVDGHPQTIGNAQDSCQGGIQLDSSDILVLSGSTSSCPLYPIS